ncbi:MAG: isoprenylcysteine carboxylmethyltransferase family protein [Fidelibacterota bacterium]|nr:MAG: isoprenylcysteine carboxylmethyltransferase family protein [Candidatus Neomarinimicrobiota bacterium]
MLRWIFFIGGTGGILWLSRKSLPDPHSHGFYRFFAFESILALILINIPFWLTDPLSIHQIFSWILLLFSLFLVIDSIYLFKVIGRPSGRSEGSANLGFENTTQLIRSGIYRYLRHPMYASLLWLGWGAYLKHPSTIGIGLVLVATAALVLTAKKEERENLSRFGDEYADYMRATRRFIPFIF